MLAPESTYTAPVLFDAPSPHGPHVVLLIHFLRQLAGFYSSAHRLLLVLDIIATAIVLEPASESKL